MRDCVTLAQVRQLLWSLPVIQMFNYLPAPPCYLVLFKVTYLSCQTFVPCPTVRSFSNTTTTPPPSGQQPLCFILLFPC